MKKTKKINRGNGKTIGFVLDPDTLEKLEVLERKYRSNGKSHTLRLIIQDRFNQMQLEEPVEVGT